MPDNPLRDQLLRSALERTLDCPPLEGIEDASVRSHVDACAYCKTELAMLKSFRDAEVPASDEAAIARITARLRKQTFRAHQSWIDRLFAAGWLRPAMLATAGALLIAGIAIEMRHREPSFNPSAAIGDSAYRSGTVTIESPVGDVQSVPDQIRWQAAANAARYKVHLMEIDQRELWSAESSTTSIAIPNEIRARIVPLKTLLIQIDAFDANGSKVAHSEVVRFRLLQNFYSH